MGFGLLFIGYFIAFVTALTKFGFAIRLAGYLLMAYSLIKLRDFELKFTWPMSISFGLIVIGIAQCVFGVCDEISYSLSENVMFLRTIVDTGESLLIIAFNLLLLWGIMSISKCLELSKQKNAAMRNIIFIIFWAVLDLLGTGPFSNNTVYINYFGLPTFIIYIAWILLNLVLIFSCYMYICPEGDEEMNRKKTNIKFIDNIIEESDRRIDKATKETTDYFENKNKLKRDNKRKK